MTNAQIYTRNIRGPATHAIVIGVGHYNHLPGGKGRRFPSPGMTQLKSPPVSARAVARWLIEDYQHPEKPLASVFLLLSDRTDTKFTFTENGNQKTVIAAPADMANVKPAVEAWRDLGDKRPDNLLLFFFCGHGLGLGHELALLLSDYGANQRAALAGAIDIRKLRNGMEECAAREQVYFIDACRVGSDLLIRNLGYAGDPIIQQTGKPNRTGQTLRGPLFFSTLAGTEAYAKPGQPSVFTEALLEALRGAGSESRGGPWRVRTTMLQHALGVLVNDASARYEIPQTQIPTGDGMNLIDLNVVATPQVPVSVTCNPDSFNRQATFTCENTSLKQERKPAKGTWRLSLPLANYDFAVKVKSKKSTPIKNFEVRPVFREVELKIK